MKIALLGAESTGKTQLGLALQAHLSAAGYQAHYVSEYLREWCDVNKRTPRKDEQLAIAQTQLERIMNSPTGAVVIADTTPIMTAVYSQMIFNDASLDAMALAHQTHYDVNLLTGLDIEWVSDGIQRDGPHVREPVDQRIRQMLTQAGLSYQVVYGKHEERLKNAMFSLARQVPKWSQQLERPEPPVRWSGTCETCGDAGCEDRLFTALLKA